MEVERWKKFRRFFLKLNLGTVYIRELEQMGKTAQLVNPRSFHSSSPDFWKEFLKKYRKVVEMALKATAFCGYKFHDNSETRADWIFQPSI